MSISLADIEALAPDQGSLYAARKLLKPASWPTLADDGAGLVWGECQGSGATPYRVIVSEPDKGYKCTCPSRKFPCKHSLALMWMRADGKTAFATGTPPDWVNDWLSRRRGPSARPARTEDGEEKPKLSIAAADAEAGAPETEADPKAEARAAAQRERLRAERESAIADGLGQLDLWLEDQMARGFSGFASVAAEQCRTISKRLVDSKAGGLAGRLETLASTLFSTPEAERADLLLESFAQLHLLTQAYRRQDALGPLLRANVRHEIGWSQNREALLADELAQRADGDWIVLATKSETQPDKLRRHEVWLGRMDEGEGPRFACLIDFVPVSVGASGPGYAVGEEFAGELVFYPSPAPLRAILGTRRAKDASACWRAARDIAGALDHYEETLAVQPWIGMQPFAVSQALMRSKGDALWLTDAEARHGVRVKPGEAQVERALLEANQLDAFGLWNGRELSLLFAETDLGRWTAQ